VTTYTFTRGSAHEHGTTGRNNTPALATYDAQVQTALTSLGTDVTTLQGNGRLVFAKGIAAEDNSTGATAGTTETGFTNYVTIPASTLAAGDRVRITAVVKATNANSTDTLALKLNVSTTTDLKTTAFTAAAVAAADSTANDIFVFTADLRVVASGAAATAKFNGFGTAIKCGGATWQNATSTDDVTTVATNAAIYVGLTYTYSASHADNVSRIKECFVSVIRPSA
jgi:hypothetical protein